MSVKSNRRIYILYISIACSPFPLLPNARLTIMRVRKPKRAAENFVMRVLSMLLNMVFTGNVCKGKRFWREMQYFCNGFQVDL